MIQDPEKEPEYWDEMYFDLRSSALIRQHLR